MWGDIMQHPIPPVSKEPESADDPRQRIDDMPQHSGANRSNLPLYGSISLRFMASYSKVYLPDSRARRAWRTVVHYGRVAGSSPHER
jgi:hypothetical protein